MEAFLAWLQKLPEATSREELSFTEERRAAIFAHLDADKDGALSLAEFQESGYLRWIVCYLSCSYVPVERVLRGKM